MRGTETGELDGTVPHHSGRAATFDPDPSDDREPNRSLVGNCPNCGWSLGPHHVLIEYETSDGGSEMFADCPGCARVVHPD